VFLKTNTDDTKHGSFRQRVLSALGCEVTTSEKLPFKGFLFNSDKKDTAVALVRSERVKEGKSYDGVVYSGRADFPVISMLRQSVLNHVTPKQYPAPKISTVNPDVVYTLLKQGVYQYAHGYVKITLEIVKVSDLRTLTKYVTVFKYTQVNKLFEIYRANNIPLFHPARLTFHNGKESIITPPVVEVHGNKNLVIEGTTRVTYSYRNDIHELCVLLIEGVTDPLPSAKQFKLDEMVISEEEREGDSR
jgi:hypothetical protein